MRRAALLVLLLLPACETASDPALDTAEITMRAATLGRMVRAAQACGFDWPIAAQDRAARIEAAALDRQGESAARDTWLRSLAAPAFDPRRRGRDRATWCSAREAEAARIAAWLDSAEGEAFARRAARDGG